MHNNNHHDNDPFYKTDANKDMDEGHRRPNEEREHDTRTFLEETSSEFTHPIREEARENEVQHAYGWIALALSVISFFFLPVLFAVSGIIVGIIARNRQSTILGYSAIVLGIISLIVQLFVLPYF